MVRSQRQYNYSGINKAEAREYKDYLTLLKDGFLLNLDLDKIKIEGFSKNKLINYLYKELDINKEKDNLHTKLKERIYFILKKFINYDYSGTNKSNEDVFEEIIQYSFNDFGIKNEVSPDLILIFIELYKKSSFLTRLDLMAIKGLSKEDFEEVIYKELQINKNEKGSKEKAIKKINKVFSETIGKMESSFKLKIPEGYKNKKWKSLDEFIDFAFSTSNTDRKGYLKVIDCAILKTMSAYSEILDNPMIVELDNKLNQIIKKIKKIPGLKIIGEIDGEIIFRYDNPSGGVPNFTKGKISYRTKDDIKILLKLIYNRKYSRLDFFKDLLGFRVEVENERDGENAILLFKQLFNNNVELDDKGFLNEDFINITCKKYGIKHRSKAKKEGTSEDFINASLYGTFKEDIQGKQNMPPAEVQFVYTGNNNESGYSKHEIYDTKKYISAMSRLFGYVSLENIKLLIHHFGLKSGLEERGILYHLFSSKKGKSSFLMKAKIGGCGSCDYFISGDVYNEKLENFYQQDLISYHSVEEKDFEAIYRKYLSIKI